MDLKMDLRLAEAEAKSAAICYGDPRPAVTVTFVLDPMHDRCNSG